MQSQPRPKNAPNANAEPPWLVLLYSVPIRPSNFRVKTWRRLQKIGALPLKGSAYLLPNSPQAREDFEWIRTEILACNGDASIFAATHLDDLTGKEIVTAFQNARKKDYAALLAAIRRAAPANRPPVPGSPQRHRLEKLTRALRERWNELDAMDPFAAHGRDEAAAALDRLDRLLLHRTSESSPRSGDTLMPSAYRNRTWLTRPRPGIDRMGSAWLIRRFIDPRARFAFAEKPARSAASVPFDMYGVEFSHHAGACTFEVLAQRFGVKDRAVARLARIVHNLDLRDEKFDAPEALTVGKLVDGLRLSHPRDPELLEHGINLFEALYLSFSGKPAASPRARPRRSK